MCWLFGIVCIWTLVEPNFQAPLYILKTVHFKYNMHSFCEDVCVSFSSVAKKAQSIFRTLKKDGGLTLELEKIMKDCKSADELDHVVSIYQYSLQLVFTIYHEMLFIR